MYCACVVKPRYHGSSIMAFFFLRSSSKGPVGFLSLPQLSTCFEALDPPSCLPFGAHCVMEGVTERPVLWLLFLHQTIHLHLPKLHILCDINRVVGYIDGKSKMGGESGRESTVRQTVPGWAESIKAHQIKNSCTLKVTNIGWGGQSCHGFDRAYPQSSSSGLSSLSSSSSSISLFLIHPLSVILLMCVYFPSKRKSELLTRL